MIEPQTTSPSSDLTRYLAERDLPCPGCGYNLRGLVMANCPECAQELELRVNLAEPRLGALIAAAAGLLTAAGSASFVLFFVAVFSVLENNFPDGDELGMLVAFPLATLMFEGPLIVLLLRARGRRWFRSLTPTPRRVVVLGGWLLNLVIGVVWVIMARAV